MANTITRAIALLALSWGIASPASAQTAAELRQQGLSYREQGQYAAAIVALKKSVELEPENLSGRVLLGWTQHKAGQSAEAAETLQQGLSKNPFDVPTLNALGIVYLVREELASAVATHTWAALLKPTNEIALYNLSLAFERLQQYDLAIATAREAARLEPSNPHPLVALAIAHWGNRENPDAQQAYRQALALDSGYASVDYLNHLIEAGFNPAQVQRTRQVKTTIAP